MSITTEIDGLVVVSHKINAETPQWMCSCFSVLPFQWFFCSSFPDRTFAHAK